MVTRNIKANTATQVNSNLIGVLVHPNTYPPIVTVDDIVVDYKYDTVTSLSVYNPGDDQRLMIEETDGGVYYWAAVSTTLDGVDYYRWDRYDSATGIWGDTLWSSSNMQEVGDNLYIGQESGGQITSMTQVSAIKSVFNVSGTFIRNDQSNYYNSNISGTYVVNGDYLCDSATGNKVGYISSKDQHIAENMTFVKGSTSSDYQTWTNDDLVSSGYGTRVLYTATDSPAVGDDALFTLNNLDYNVQTIKAIDTTETPVDPDPVECTVSYSTDGVSFTEHPTVLTDDNNVICNIPRYVYLKFSQDVEITEE